MKKWLIAISMLCTLGLSGMASADDAAPPADAPAAAAAPAPDTTAAPMAAPAAAPAAPAAAPNPGAFIHSGDNAWMLTSTALVDRKSVV